MACTDPRPSGAATLTTRRSVKESYQAAWLLNAVRCIDLIKPAGNATEEQLRRFCARRVSRSRLTFSRHWTSAP